MLYSARTEVKTSGRVGFSISMGKSARLSRKAPAFSSVMQPLAHGQLDYVDHIVELQRQRQIEIGRIREPVMQCFS